MWACPKYFDMASFPDGDAKIQLSEVLPISLLTPSGATWHEFTSSQVLLAKWTSCDDPDDYLPHCENINMKNDL